MANVPTNYEGPVCNLNTNRNTVQPDPPITPQIPVATDLASALQAINKMAQTLQNMLGQGWGPNNFYFGGGGGGGFGGGGGGGGQRPPPKPPNPSDFVEVPGTRRMTTVRIYNPQDHTQYVDVEQVEHVQFANKLKQKLTYTN